MNAPFRQAKAWTFWRTVNQISKGFYYTAFVKAANKVRSFGFHEPQFSGTYFIKSSMYLSMFDGEVVKKLR